jgi:hypothetical protein
VDQIQAGAGKDQVEKERDVRRVRVETETGKTGIERVASTVKTGRVRSRDRSRQHRQK